MKTRKMQGAVLLFGLLALVACDQDGTGLLTDDLTPEEVQELVVLEDESSMSVALELVTVSDEVAGPSAVGAAQVGRGHHMQAQLRFAAAREALQAGDRRRALEEARSGRRLLVRALLAFGGPDAIDALIERIEDLSLTDVDDDDVFVDPAAVADALGRLADVARDRLAANDMIGGGERALLGEQIARYHRGQSDRRGDVHPDRARLAVALAETAVDLAERIIAAEDVAVRDAVTDVADHQNRWLAHAKRMLNRAQMALENGNHARAVHFAQHAHWSALKAVILPGGITEAEIEDMIALADELFAQADEVVGDDSPELEQKLLQRAARLIEIGKTRLEEGHKRGLAALWRASVICAWLVG